MIYDKIIKKHIDSETINYGIVFGNEKIVFIKTGADGNIKGYKDKYLKMAQRVHERMGATVICASNPYIECGHEATDKLIISQIASEVNCSEYEVYFFGTSDGAHHNLVLAKEIPQTVRLLAINPSLIDFDEFKDKLLELPQISKTIVYGTKDELSDFFSTLKELKCDNLETITINEADHDFNGMLEEYIALIDLL